MNCYILALEDWILFPPDLMSSSRCSGRPMSQTESQGEQKTGSCSYLTMSLHVAIAHFSFTIERSSYIGYTRHDNSLSLHTHTVSYGNQICALQCPAAQQWPVLQSASYGCVWWESFSCLVGFPALHTGLTFVSLNTANHQSHFFQGFADSALYFLFSFWGYLLAVYYCLAVFLGMVFRGLPIHLELTWSISL